MKKSIIYLLAAGIILAVILYFTLNSGTEGTAPAKTEEHSEETGIKEVELNEAQYKASEIELGTFSDKNLSEVIHANGYTKLPPQNQADHRPDRSAGRQPSRRPAGPRHCRAGRTCRAPVPCQGRAPPAHG